MFAPVFQQHLRTQLDGIRSGGLYKSERVIITPQDARIKIAGGREVLNLCANNYLGFAEHPEVVAAARAVFMSSAFPTPSCRRAGRASARKSPPRIPAKTSPLPWKNSRK